MTQDFEAQMEAMFAKQPKEAIHEFLKDVSDYIGFVNRVSELMRLSDGIGTEALDADITVGDVMLSLVRKGEKLRTTADILHEYASKIEQKQNKLNP